MTFARRALPGLALLLGAAAVGSTPGLAGGEVYQGPPVRQSVPVAIPVPVPVPVPEVASGFYVRLDAAYSQGDVSKYRSTDPRVDGIRGDSYLDNFPRFGFGAGYQFNRWLRADLTLDWRDDVKSNGTGSVDYTIPNTQGPNATIAMRDTFTDTFKSTNMTGLANLYVDVPATSWITPYFGGGVGFVRHQLRGRNFTRTTTCIDPVDCDPGTAGNQGASTVDSAASAIAGGVEVSLAAAAMAGVSFQFSEWGKIDVGYRFLYLQGAKFVGRNATTVENLTIPDQNIHEIRVGLRWDIN